MNNVIWKYPIPMPNDEFSIEMPKHAKILTLQMQNGIPQMWVLVDMKYKDTEIKRTFRICGTGIEFKNETLSYIGTYQLGEYVFHLFEKVSIGTKIIEEIL